MTWSDAARKASAEARRRKSKGGKAKSSTPHIPHDVLERHRAAARRAGANPAVVDTPEYRRNLAKVRAEK